MDRTKLVELAEQALGSALKLSREETGWNRACDLGCGGEGRIEWREGEPGGIEREDGQGQTRWRAWRVKQVLEADLETVGRIIMDIDNMQTWNPALKHSQVEFFCPNQSLPH